MARQRGGRGLGRRCVRRRAVRRRCHGRPLSDKSKLVAGLLQIFLGGFGIGRFYLGYTNIGLAQIAVSVLTCGIGAIWPFIDGFMMIAGKVPDAEARTLRD